MVMGTLVDASAQSVSLSPPTAQAEDARRAEFARKELTDAVLLLHRHFRVRATGMYLDRIDLSVDQQISTDPLSRPLESASCPSPLATRSASLRTPAARPSFRSATDPVMRARVKLHPGTPSRR